jgi:hypothetical protein
LQGLPQIVTIPQSRVLINNNIDFDIEFIAGVIGLDTLDLLDGLRKAHRHVEENVSLVC